MRSPVTTAVLPALGLTALLVAVLAGGLHTGVEAQPAIAHTANTPAAPATPAVAPSATTPAASPVANPAVNPSGSSAATAPQALAPASQTQSSMGPPFSSLSAYQAEVLKPLQPVWDELGDVRKRKWIEIANRLPTLSDDEKNRITQRMQEWAALTPAQRKQVRDNFTEASARSAAERQAQWEEYQKLSPEARQALAERAQQELRQKRDAANSGKPVGAAATTRPSNRTPADSSSGK